MAKVTPRSTVATALVGPEGEPRVVTESGLSIPLAVRPSDPGIGPLELQSAALAACLALSLSIAARRAGVGDRLRGVEVRVEGAKAPDPPSRLAELSARYVLDADLTEAEREALIEAAEGLCTISNSLKQGIALRGQADGEARAVNLGGCS